MWKDDESTFALLAILREVISGARMAARVTRSDVLLFDRHWMTVLGEIDGRPTVSQDWSDFVLLFFIRAPPSKTKACDRFSYELGWTSSDEKVEYYYRRYLEIARRYRQYVLGSHEVTHKRQPLEPIITSVTEIILDAHRRG